MINFGLTMAFPQFRDFWARQVHKCGAEVLRVHELTGLPLELLLRG